MIHYLQREQIDTEKWDRCIDRAYNGRIYAYSYYLDYMSRHWDALVLGDYEAVMPLTWNKKYGVKYLYQPAFTASLGIFGNDISPALCARFLNAIPPVFRLVEIDLNQGNTIPEGMPMTIMRTNYVLDLRADYGTIYNGYRENIRRNIKKCEQLGVRYVTNLPVEKVVRLSAMQMTKRGGIKPSDYDRFIRLYGRLRQRGKALTCGVLDASGELVASCVYFFSHQRAYYILVGNHPNGRTMGASHYLIDRFIHDHAGRNMLLDFEGSDIRNLAFFYSSFGAVTEAYPALRINRLPWWVNFVRRFKR